MNEKTLIILLGNARGGEFTWETMYKNLQEPYNADIALCFGYKEDKDNSLYKKAKYIWEINEYENWYEYYNQYFYNYDQWDRIFNENKHTGLMGGINNEIGSGAIIFALRHFLLKNYKNIMLKYNRIILTRSDYFYIDKHPLLDNNYFYIVEGEDYGGITDRHHIFNTKHLNDVLNVCEFICDKNNFSYILENKNINPEILLKLFFNKNGMFNLIKRIKRVQFAVSIPNEQTRWSIGVQELPENKNLRIKYMSEYELAINNKRFNK